MLAIYFHQPVDIVARYFSAQGYIPAQVDEYSISSYDNYDIHASMHGISQNLAESSFLPSLSNVHR